ncbi:LacI family DNA-binding transcriptional regulator [Inconstantimicrobium mannanitabidum]|uniref:LacI family transcriptional regulator n=1 Tax=Inconstantimicrobium mannanitabidum TaxID=1604901 RepID=A0ACB5RDX0_9CLOT|nr:LacI family DNA-binding transcriptional regulator [Clostridium sp. TW13]GKX67377.1 LacI family transcriptional regulator [Clostridium sp. TW13]
MKGDKVKISDIAKELEVSTISVSRALAGQSGVGDELRNRIISKAKEMGYFKAKNNEDIKILVLHQKPFVQDTSNYSQMVQGIERSIQTKKCEYDLEFVDKEHQDQLYLPNKIQKGINFDGIIFIGRFNSDYVKFISSRIKNQVFYTGYSPSFDCDSVWYNFNNGGYKQCECLIKNGHREIGFIGGCSVYKNKEKVLGITSALEDYNLPIRDEFFIYEENFEERVAKLISSNNGPTAIICQWDYTAIKLIKCLHEKGIKVPEDISIVGSGNTEISSLSIPALTTLELNIDYACEMAVELLLKRINKPDKPYENITINSILIERDSVKNCMK